MEFQIDNGELKTAWGYDERVKIPDGVTAIGEGVFASFSYLEQIELPRTLKSIGEHAFSSCLELKSLYIPDGVDSIGEYAFQYCKKLKTIHLPSSLREIKSCTFRYCESLKKIELPAQIAYVDYDAFFGCTELEYFSSGAERFGRRVFYGCDSLMHFDAAHAALSKLDEDQLAHVCEFFCKSPEEYSPNAVAAYKNALKSPCEAFMYLICKNDNYLALSYPLKNGLFARETASEFLDAAQKAGANKCAGALLGYINHFGPTIDDSMAELEI